MAGVIFLQLIINAIAFSFIFWILTFVAKAFFSNKYYDYKLNFYECGFKNISRKKINYEINYVMIVLFLLIYDGEFLFLIPFALNTRWCSSTVCFCFIFFIVWLVIALLFDYALGALDWQIKCYVLHPIILIKKLLRRILPLSVTRFFMFIDTILICSATLHQAYFFHLCLNIHINV